VDHASDCGDAFLAGDQRVTSRKRPRELRAYHEAGHAVAAFRLGSRVHGISVADADLLRRCDGGPADDEIDAAVRSRDRGRTERIVILLCVGVIAEQRCAGRRARQDGSPDLQRARELLSRLYAGSTEQQAAYYAWLFVRAKDLIDAHWTDVQALAQQLLDVERMSSRLAGTFLKALIQEQLPKVLRGGAPPGGDPSELWQE
jgi:hypothetical protein